MSGLNVAPVIDWAGLANHAPSVVLGPPGSRSGQDLFAAVQAVQERISPAHAAHSGHSVLLDCDDRYRFAIGLLGAWRSGLIAALPASRAPAAYDALLSQRGMVGRMLDRDLDRETEPLSSTITSLDLRPLDRPVQASSQANLGTASTGGRPGDPGVVLYTSGSTGAPQGITKTLPQLLREAAQHATEFGFLDCTVLSTVPPQHIYGLLWSVLAPLLGGGRMVRSTPQLPDEVAHAAQTTGAQMLVSVPAHLGGIAELPQLTSLRCIVSSGAPLPEGLARALEARHRVRVVEVLGSTETGGIAQRRTAQTTRWTPLSGVAVRADGDGRLWVRSPFADGPEDAERACQDRIVCYDNGEFDHLGRADSVVKVGGRRVDLAALRSRLCRLPGVREAVVVAPPTEGARGRLVACVLEVAPGHAYDRATVRQALRPWFHLSALPRVVRVVDSLPRTGNGKVAIAQVEALVARRGVNPAGPPTTKRVPDGAEGGSTTAPAATSVAATDPMAQVAAVFDVASVTAASQGTDHGQRNAAGQLTQLTAEVRVRADAWCFGGHFPGDPVLPGVVQLNNLVVPLAEAHFAGLGPLSEVRGLKFKRKILPEDALSVSLVADSPPPEAAAAPGHRLRFRIERGSETCALGSLHFEAAPAPGSPQP